jgi:Flp pilus assembly protein TadG
MKIRIFNLLKNKYLNNLKNDESGSIVVIILLSMIVIMGLAALAIDMGSASLQAERMQNVVDVAAYSAGRMLPVNSSSATDIAAIKDSAISYASLNGLNGLTRNDVILENNASGNYTSIKVTATKNIPTTFAKILGYDSVEITKHSKVILSPSLKVKNVTPLGLSAVELTERLATGQYTHIVLKYGKGGSERGFFGALDLNGQGGGANDYRRWIAQGFEGDTVLGDILLRESGNMVGPTYQGFSTRFNGCTHYGAQSGGPGCTAEHYDPDCPRVAKVVIYTVNSGFTIKVAGFAAFLLEAQTDEGQITGTFLHTINTAGQGSGEVAGSSLDYGLYSLMLSKE